LILYICKSSTRKHDFTKKANILQILLLLLFLSSCKQKNTPEAKAVLKKPIETALIIQQGPKLAAYIKSKKIP
jgi:PBP1b-binding outer membrane lipoprotein LpoB